jgi:Transposase DDE domain
VSARSSAHRSGRHTRTPKLHDWACRRVGAEPLRRLFETLAGPVGLPGQAGVFYRGLRTVAVDGTHLHVPDDPAITWRYPKRAGERLEFGYPLLRLLALIECGTRAVLAAAFGPDTAGELACAGALLNALDATMLLLADAGAIGRAALRDLLPAWRRPRLKARTRKNPTSKYGPNASQHPTTAQTYTFHAHITFFAEGLAPRARR